MSFLAVWATVTRPGEALEDGKDPPCIRDTIRDVQRHMGASTWVKMDRKSVKMRSRKTWTRVISGRLGDGDSTRRGPGAWSWTERIPRAYETRSETHGCKYMGENGSKISENQIQTKMDTRPCRGLYASVTEHLLANSTASTWSLSCPQLVCIVAACGL